MDKKSANSEKCLEKRRRLNISMSLLFSYLLILLAPAIAIIVVYLTASHAFEESQKERIQSMLSEARLTFDREVQQAQNVGRYVSSERRLTDHLGLGYRPGRTDEFYAVYTIASNYPNYSLTNSIIKDVYVLISESRYIIKIPQVIPETQYGAATLSHFPFSSYEDFMEYYNEQDKSNVLFLSENKDGEELLFLPCQMKYPYSWPGKSAVVVELDWKRVREILEPTLGEQEGIAALLDEDGQILTGVEISPEGRVSQVSRVPWKEYLKEKGYSGNAVISTKYSTYNGWHLITAVPERVLTQRIGMIRHMVVAFCVLAVLIGLFVCFAYWGHRRSMVEKYFLLQERMGVSDKKVWFWGTFGGFLQDVDRMWDTMEKQKEIIRGEFLRKLLYGGYDSMEGLREDGQRADISLDAPWFYAASIELDTPLGADFQGTTEEFRKIFREYLNRYLPWSYYTYQVSDLSGALLVLSDSPAEKELKDALEQLSGELYDKYKVSSYIGVSPGCEDALKLEHEYEIALRLVEFARMYEIHVPVDSTVLSQESLAEPPAFLTIDTELKLLKLIQGGSADQLETLISQIRDLYFPPGGSRYARQHTMEILKSCIYRSLSLCGKDERAAEIQEAARRACGPEEVFGLIREAKECCARYSRERKETVPSLDRKGIEKYIEEHYSNPGLNLSMLAEQLGMSERKLYGDFKLSFGMTFSAFLEKYRIDSACALLKAGTAVGETARLSGYGSDYSFRRAFKRVIGISPSDFQKIKADK